MIRPGSGLMIDRIPLAWLHVTEYQQRYPDRVMHYVKLLNEHPDADPGIIHVQHHDGGYEILDGHHRYCALIIAGRPNALCLIINEPKENTHDHQR